MENKFRIGDRILVSAVVEKVAEVPTNWPVRISLDSGASETIDNGGNVHFSAIQTFIGSDEKPLNQLIDLWAGIVKLHNDDLGKPVEQTTLRKFTQG